MAVTIFAIALGSTQLNRDRRIEVVLSDQLLSHYRQLSQQLLTVVDLETTGRYASDSHILEISVLQATLKEGIQQQQTHLIHPPTEIPAKIIAFTGITPAMVASAPAAAEILPHYWPLLRAGVLTAHNLEFDYSFLQAEYDRLGIAFARAASEQLCTVQLARLMLPDLPSRRLSKLVKHFQFNVGRSHRAAADTLACWLLVERLLTEILNEDDAELLARFAKQAMPLKYAAQLLGCAEFEAQQQLATAAVPARYVGRRNQGTWVYRRGDVERVLHEQQAQRLT